MTTKKYVGRTANVKRNIFYGLIQVVASRILPFISRTILIYRFGAEYLGLNSLFISILSVLSLMELGFGTAIVYCMYKPAAENDTEQICAYLLYYRRIYRFVGLVILILGLLMLLVLKYLIYDSTMPDGLNIYTCYLFFLSDSVLSYLLYGYLTSLPLAFQRRDILSKIDICIAILKCLIQCFILLLFRNFYIYLFVMPATTILHNLVNAHMIKKVFPDMKCRGNLTTIQKIDINRKVRGLLINKITSKTRTSVDSLCISAFIGLTATGMYNNYFYVIATLATFSVMICNSMMASVGNSIAVESNEKNYNDMRLFDFIYMTVAGWATVCMLCMYQPFIIAWVGENMTLGLPVVIGFCIYFYILKTGDIRWVYHEGAGLWWESRYIMIGEAIANVVLNILLCRIIGVSGIILATVISVFVTNCILCPKLIFKEYFKNGKLHEYWLDHIWYMVTMTGTAGISWIICEILFPICMVTRQKIRDCAFCLGGRLVVCSIMAVVVFWIIWHKSERYKKAISWTRKLLNI